MKKIFLFLSVVSLSFVSCNDDSGKDDVGTPVTPEENNNEENGKQQVLQSKWEVQSYILEATKNGSPIPSDEIDTENLVGMTFEFKVGGVLIITEYDTFGSESSSITCSYVYNTAKNKIEYTAINPQTGTKYTKTLTVKYLDIHNFNFNTTEEQKSGKDIYKVSIDLSCETKN